MKDERRPRNGMYHRDRILSELLLESLKFVVNICYLIAILVQCAAVFSFVTESRKGIIDGVSIPYAICPNRSNVMVCIHNAI